MKRILTAAGLLALCATQVGCVVDPCTEPGNGNERVLHFSNFPDTSQGLQTRAVLYRQNPGWWEGPFLLTRDPATCFNFDGAEVQAELPAAFGGEVATVGEAFDAWGALNGVTPNFAIQFKCSAPDGETQQVKVRVVGSGGEVRHEDSFNVTCHTIAAASAAAVPRGRDLHGSTDYVVGGVVHVMLQPESRVDTTMHGLPGFGAVSLDPMLEPSGRKIEFDEMETFRITAPGQDPLLQIGPVRATLPMRAIGGDGWALTLEAFPDPNGGGRLSAWPKALTGDILNGLETCRWTASTGTRSEVLPDTACDLVQVDKMPGTGERITEMCVTALERTACVPVAREQR